jgi:hypothetical protein
LRIRVVALTAEEGVVSASADQHDRYYCEGEENNAHPDRDVE